MSWEMLDQVGKLLLFLSSAIQFSFEKLKKDYEYMQGLTIFRFAEKHLKIYNVIFYVLFLIFD